jgi:hypothetical protein
MESIRNYLNGGQPKATPISPTKYDYIILECEEAIENMEVERVELEDIFNAAMDNNNIVKMVLVLKRYEVTIMKLYDDILNYVIKPSLPHVGAVQCKHRLLSLRTQISAFVLRAHDQLIDKQLWQKHYQPYIDAVKILPDESEDMFTWRIERTTAKLRDDFEQIMKQMDEQGKRDYLMQNKMYTTFPTKRRMHDPSATQHRPQWQNAYTSPKKFFRKEDDPLPDEYFTRRENPTQKETPTRKEYYYQKENTAREEGSPRKEVPPRERPKVPPRPRPEVPPRTRPEVPPRPRPKVPPRPRPKTSVSQTKSNEICPEFPTVCSGTIADRKKAYHTLMRKYHPDRCSDVECARNTVVVNNCNDKCNKIM